MARIRLLFVATLAACGGSPKPNGNLIPESSLAAEPVAAEPAPKEPAPSEPAPSEPAEPTGPLGFTLDAVNATVKLLDAGKGARAPLRFAPSTGAQQTVDLLMSAHIEQGPTGLATDKSIMPEVRLSGASEITSVSDGVISYRTVITGTGAKEVTGQSVSVADIERQVASLVGMTIQGKVSAQGIAKESSYSVEKPSKSTAAALSSVRVLLPSWPPLPTEPIGLGATWEVSQEVVLNNIRTTQITTYALRGRSGTTATISGTVKVTGSAQRIDNVEIGDIGGAGTTEIVLDTAKVYPKLKRDVTTKMRLREGAEDFTVQMRINSAFEPH